MGMLIFLIKPVLRYFDPRIPFRLIPDVSSKISRLAMHKEPSGKEGRQNNLTYSRGSNFQETIVVMHNRCLQIFAFIWPTDNTLSPIWD